jgi:DNA-binding MarR family transcriptional regulator
MTMPNPLFLREEDLDRGLDLLYLAGRRVAAEVRVLLAEAGLDETDHRILFGVERRPGATLAELCGAMAMPKQTLSRHLRGLAARGLLVPHGEAGTDRRRRPLAVTAEGRALLLRLNAAQKRRLRQAFKGAGAVAVEGFQRVLAELAPEPSPRGGAVAAARRQVPPPPRAEVA